MKDLFTYHDPLTPDRLTAYAKGELPPEEQHDVELLLEESPLHSEAVEGMREIPNASFVDLQRHRPASGGSVVPWIIGTGLFIGAGAIAWMLLGQAENKNEPLSQDPAITGPATEQENQEDTHLAVSMAEIAAAQELPESLQIGHEPIAERPPVDPALVIDRTEVITRLDPKPVTLDRSGTEAYTQQPKGAPRQSRQLVFLHDLKLVHPDELYPERPPMFFQTGVPASVAEGLSEPTDPNAQVEFDTAAWNKLMRDAQPKVPYLDYIDHALAAFAKGDHRRSLEELRYLLDQYPEDVNALFYAGLNAYDLGLTNRARSLFAKARDHRIDSFREESEWYYALCVQKLDGSAAARSYFQKIAQQGSFYADKAKLKLQ